MFKNIALVAAFLIAAVIATPVIAQDNNIPVKTVYEDMRVICGNETGTPYKVRVMRETALIKREAKKAGFAVMVVRINPFDQPPAGVKVRTKADCKYN